MDYLSSDRPMFETHSLVANVQRNIQRSHRLFNRVSLNSKIKMLKNGAPPSVLAQVVPYNPSRSGGHRNIGGWEPSPRMRFQTISPPSDAPKTYPSPGWV